jgi:hypothetical protein
MIRLMPSRRTTLQCSHSFLMEGRTFMVSSRSLESVNDAAAGEVVGGHLYENPVTGKDADEVLAHLSADVRQHLVFVLQFDPEDRVRLGLNHCGFELNGFFFAQACSPKT